MPGAVMRTVQLPVDDLARSGDSRGSVEARGTGAATCRPEREHWVLFEPGAVLPAQWHWHDAADASRVPERRLLLAVLEDAIATLQRYVLSDRRRGRRLFQEAEAWILSDDLGWPCAFRNICDELDIDAVYMRRGVSQWCERRRASPFEGARNRYAFRRLGGSRTRTIGRPIGMSRGRVRDEGVRSGTGRMAGSPRDAGLTPSERRAGAEPEGHPATTRPAPRTHRRFPR